ncbi:MAG: DUF1015 family protein [Bacteroidia bacterium]
MPAFKPFKGIIPNPDFAADVILPANKCWNRDSFTVVQGHNPYSFQHILEAANPDLELSSLKQACALSAKLFSEALDKGVYIHDNQPAYYLYHTRYKGIEQTGIIGLCEAGDIAANKIRKHENTRNDRVEQLYTFLEATGLFTTPVFLTYHPIREIESLIHRIKLLQPIFNVHSGKATDHSIWKITSPDDLAIIEKSMGQIDSFYIADGHHRAAIAEKLVQQDSRGGDMLSILIAANNLTIYPFYRQILNDEGPIDLWELLDKLKANYQLKPCSLDQMYYQYLPSQHFLLCTAQASWLLIPKNPGLSSDVLADLDVSILQNEILSPLLHITDPKADPRIQFGPMSIKLEEFKALLHKPETAMVFICRAPLAEVIFKVADQGKVMPPKSTSFEPKILSGLVLHHV